MRRVAICGLIAAITVSAAMLAPLAEDRKANALLQSGKNEETLGNRKRAGELYEQAVQEAGNNRELAAKILLQLGLMYQRIGENKAITVFDHIAKDYPEQTAAAEARTRASAIRASRRATVPAVDGPELLMRLLWQDDRINDEARVSSDGRYVAFIDRSPDGGLIIHDLTTGKDKVLVKSGGDELRSPTFSRDGKRLAYASREASQTNYKLKVIEVSGAQDSGRILTEGPDSSYLPKDWTTSGQILTLISTRSGARQISLIDAFTGRDRLLTILGSREPGNLTLSLDGRFLAYDFQEENSAAREIFAGSVDGVFQEHALAKNPVDDRVLGWTPDGRWLLFASDRAGSTGIWAIETLEGKPVAGAQPLLLEKNVGAIHSLGITRAGALAYTLGGKEVRVAENLLPEIARLLIARVQQPSTPALASIEGIVVEMGTNQPIADAAVELTRLQGTPSSPLNPGAAEAFAALSDRNNRAVGSLRPSPPPALAPEVQYATTTENGRFVFRNLKPGGYRLIAAPRGNNAGNSGARYGQRNPAGDGLIFPITEGQTLRDAKLELVPPGTITGRVFDADGEALPHAMVVAVTVFYKDGRRVLIAKSAGLTDERGEYRLSSRLTPGRYYIAAKMEELSEMFVPRAFPKEYGGSPVIARRMSPNGEVIEETYGLVYHGGGLDVEHARPIDVGPGSTSVSGVDVSLSSGKMRSHHIRGVLINGATGQPAAGIQVRAVPLRQAPIAMFPFGVTDADGAFDLSGAVPGGYVVLSESFRATTAPAPNAPNAADLAAAVNAGQMTAAEAQNILRGPQIGGQIRVEMGNADVENLRIVATSASNLSGRVAVEGGGDPDLTKIQVTLTWDPDVLGMPNTGQFGGPAANARVRPDGGFMLSAAAGNYRMSISGIPANVFIKSARFGNADILRDGLHVAGMPDGPIDIVLATNAGELEGVAVNNNYDQMPNVVVALVPESALLRARDDLYVTASTDAAGRFRLRTIAPGDYKLFAWEYVEAGAWHDPQFLAPYEQFGVPIQIKEGKNPEARVTVRK